MVVADIFFRYQGYCTDCTRTYGVGRVTEEWREVSSCPDAQLEGLELAKKGARCKRRPRGRQRCAEEAQLEKYFTHGTGHGVGIDIHERPSIGSDQ